MEELVYLISILLTKLYKHMIKVTDIVKGQIKLTNKKQEQYQR